jgi:hypothetical protein
MARATSKRQSGTSSTKPAVKTKSRNPLTKPKKAATRKPKQTKGDDDADDMDTNALSEDEGEAYELSEGGDTEELDSDALDEEEHVSEKKRKKPQRSPKMGSTPLKKQRRKQGEDEDEEGEELPEGLTFVGEVVCAPTEGRGGIFRYG